MTALLERIRLGGVSGDHDAAKATDAELLAAIDAGDRVALAELYARHSAWLLLRLSRRCSDRGLIDEALQDTFVAVWRRPTGWSGQGEVAAWLWGIAVRRLVDGLRRQPAATVPLPDVDGVAGSDASAEDEALAAGRYGAVSIALRGLPADLRAAMEATVIDGLTTAEAALALGIPTGTVKTRVMRAKAALRRALS